MTSLHFSSVKVRPYNNRQKKKRGIFYKQYLTPIIHIYNARGEIVKEITLPEDEVDMIR